MKNAILSRALDHWKRHWLLLLGDLLVELVAVYAAMLMRFAPLIPEGIVAETTHFLPWLVISYVGVFLLFGMYRVVWRCADSKQMVFLSFANIVGCGVSFLWNSIWDCELSLYFLLIHFALSLAGTCGIRMALRVVNEAYSSHRQKDDFQMDSHRLLIVGAGKAGSEAIQRALERPDSLGEPIAIADDDERKIGASIRGVPVRGAIGDIPQIVRNCAITDILIALPSVHGERLQEIIGICKRTHCYVRLLRLTDEGTSCERLFAREPDISDFLSRPGMRVNDERIRAFVENRTVLITGGAGSLGAELIRQLLPYHPGKIIAFDISDNYAAELETELRRRFGAFLPVDFEIGSVCDKKRVDEVFRACRPDIVLHAAAHKHISLAESSPAEAVQTNVFGLINALDAARTTQCDSFVLLSSECAVNPVSVLGACARVCEDLISLYAEKNSMNAFTVRFGNVLASHGSVLPLLVKQIHNGGPVTLTNPDAERYFITLSEAAQLILEASAAGHRGQTYVLDMGSPMKVRDLALRLIRFCGLEPDTDIPIQTTNLRPGEKLYSEMYTEAEAIRLSQTDNDRILGMQSSLPDHSVSEETLTALRTERTPEKIRELLQTLVPSYHPAQ